MEPLPDQQQAYQDEQQARAPARQINAKQWAAQHHDELAGEQAAVDAEMTELHRCKPALGMERGTAIDYTKARSRARAITVAISPKGTPPPLFPGPTRT
jgi:hypothetical protein